jgi:hypothetical protein
MHSEETHAGADTDADAPSDVRTEESRALDALAARLGADLDGRGLGRMALPGEDARPLLGAGSFAGERVEVRPAAWRDRRVPFGRLVRVEGGQRVQVFNAVCFPSLSVSLPVLGCEILCFSKGVHLFVLDAFALDERSEADRAVRAALCEARADIAAEFSMMERPDWGAEVFSPEAILLKPGARAEVSLERFVPALDRVWSAWCEQLGRARAEREGWWRRRARRRRYLADHAADEPARPFLSRIFGEDRAGTFIDEFLFPRWLHGEDGSPDWAPSQGGPGGGGSEKASPAGSSRAPMPSRHGRSPVTGPSRIAP